MCWLKTAPCTLQALMQYDAQGDAAELRSLITSCSFRSVPVIITYISPSQMFGSGNHKRWQMGNLFRPAPVVPPPPSKSTKRDVEAFFDKYRSLLPSEEFDKFRDLVGRTRPGRTSRYFFTSSSGKLGYEYLPSVRTQAERSKNADLSKMEIVLVEDVDEACLVALDTVYQLDPEFLLAYTSMGDKHSRDFEATADPADMTGKWYVAEMAISVGYPWLTEESRFVKKYNTSNRPLYKTLLAGRHATERGALKPWWEEEIRTGNFLLSTKVRSKIACYCLTDKLRESGRTSELLVVDRR